MKRAQFSVSRKKKKLENFWVFNKNRVPDIVLSDAPTKTRRSESNGWRQILRTQQKEGERKTTLNQEKVATVCALGSSGLRSFWVVRTLTVPWEKVEETKERRGTVSRTWTRNSFNPSDKKSSRYSTGTETSETKVFTGENWWCTDPLRRDISLLPVSNNTFS